MKKVLLSLTLVMAITGVSFAQGGHDGHNHATGAHTDGAPQATVATPTPAVVPPSSNLKPENMDFKEETHDFGTVAEGPDISYEFEFKNTGKEPIIIQSVNVSCGCTSPSFSKDPILPGKKGKIPVVYHTQGRVAAFTKPITVMSNAGTKVITIKGNVEKAPETSAPAAKSMVKMN